MLEPVRDRKDAVAIEELANRRFFRGGVLDPGIDILCHWKRRHHLVAVLFVCFKGDGAIPFLPSHGEQLLWRIWIEGDVSEEENISVASERGLGRKRGKYLLQMLAETIERVGRPGIGRASCR